MKIFAILWSLMSAITAAPWSMSPHLTDQMVLQRDRPHALRGTAGSGEVIQIEFAKFHATCTADQRGDWSITLPALAANAVAQTMRIRCGSVAHDIHDVLIGDVWMFSGQSNMDFPLAKAIGGKAEIADAKALPIRLLHLTGIPTDQRRYDEATRRRLTAENFFIGSWQQANPQTKAPLSAIAWWTARTLTDRSGVPIGIIENAVGGSGTEAWLSEAALRSKPSYAPLCDDWLHAPLMSPWARERAAYNLGNDLTGQHPFRPGFLYKATFSQLATFPLKGVVWYQGETNAEINNIAYNQELLSDLIHDWRKAWDHAQLPFYLIELPRIGGNDPLRQHWPQYRQAQAQCAASGQHIHLIPTTDLGYDLPEIHPPEKKPIALRVAETILKQSTVEKTDPE